MLFVGYDNRAQFVAEYDALIARLGKAYALSDRNFLRRMALQLLAQDQRGIVTPAFPCYLFHPYIIPQDTSELEAYNAALHRTYPNFSFV